MAVIAVLVCPPTKNALEFVDLQQHRIEGNCRRRQHLRKTLIRKTDAGQTQPINWEPKLACKPKREF